MHELLGEWSGWGWAVAASHLWQATLFSAVAIIAVLLLRRGPARARYAVWLIASMKFALPSVVILLLANRLGLDFSALISLTEEPAAGAVVATEFAEPVIQLAGQEVSYAEPAPSHNEIYCALTIIWLIGCAAVTGFWCGRRRQFSRALKAGKLVARGREALALEKVRSWLAIRRSVRLVLSPQIMEPGVWRVFRPVIVLPENVADHLSDAELEAVMMHELIHIARWDNLAGNLLMALCCLFWFHPLVWLIDRKALAERERACDDRVIELGGASKVYASTLLKVLRFCLGSKMAGVSNATGSNLRRRIDQIMAEDVDRSLATPHRLLVTATAAAVIVFSIAAGLLSGEAVIAQSSQPTASNEQSSLRINADGDAGLHQSGQKVEEFDAQWEQATEFVIAFENFDEAPVTITDARVKAIPYTRRNGSADRPRFFDENLYQFLPSVTLVNNMNKRITGLAVSFIDTASHKGIYIEMIKLDIAPYGSYTFSKQWIQQLTREGRLDFLKVVPVKVLFEDGSKWVLSPPPPPPPPPAPSITEPGAPPPPPPSSAPVITEPGAPPPPPPPPVEISGDVIHMAGNEVKMTRFVRPRYPPLARAAKVSGEVIVDILIDEEGNVAWAKAVSGHPLLKDDAVEAARQCKFAPTTISGEPVKVMTTIHIGFDQRFDTDYRPRVIRKSGGVLQGSAIRRVQPNYPDAAKEAGISGAVVVEVVIDEEGYVVSATALSGHPFLKDAAVEAAQQWQFTPTSLSGEPVRVIGTITFNFSL